MCVCLNVYVCMWVCLCLYHNLLQLGLYTTRIRAKNPPSQLNPPLQPLQQHVDKWSKPKVEEGNLGLQSLLETKKYRFGQSSRDYWLTVDHKTIRQGDSQDLSRSRGCWMTFHRLIQKRNTLCNNKLCSQIKISIISHRSMILFFSPERFSDNDSEWFCLCWGHGDMI